MKKLTTENGKLNRRWFNNRLRKGEVKPYEKNMNEDQNDWKEISVNENFINMLSIHDDGNRIVGHIGTSYYYQFTLRS